MWKFWQETIDRRYECGKKKLRTNIFWHLTYYRRCLYQASSLYHRHWACYLRLAFASNYFTNFVLWSPGSAYQSLRLLMVVIPKLINIAFQIWLNKVWNHNSQVKMLIEINFDWFDFTSEIIEISFYLFNLNI